MEHRGRNHGRLAGAAGLTAVGTSAAFPRDFAWGVASASYQIEGSPTADGKGPSVWDMFCRKPGAIWGGQTGDTACDGYRRWREDVRLMKELGIRAYRFSVSWPRVLSEGTGTVNRKGLDFYRALVDALRDAGIEPWVTLFHWDYPLALYHRGGWLNADSPDGSRSMRPWSRGRCRTGFPIG